MCGTCAGTCAHVVLGGRETEAREEPAKGACSPPRGNDPISLRAWMGRIPSRQRHDRETGSRFVSLRGSPQSFGLPDSTSGKAVTASRRVPYSPSNCATARLPHHACRRRMWNIHVVVSVHVTGTAPIITHRKKVAKPLYYKPIQLYPWPCSALELTNNLCEVCCT